MQGRDKEVMAESLSVIVQSSDTIKRLVDEFVSVAKMPQAQLRRANLIEAVRFAVAAFADNPENIKIHFEVQKSTDSHFLVYDSQSDYGEFVLRFDRDQIVRAVINLISNAIAASAVVDGAERVVVRVGMSQQQSVAAEVSVIDWGQGIPEQMRNRVFEPYFSTKRSGTGLGLVIVQQIAHEHGGQIHVAANNPRGPSEPGEIDAHSK
jgi:two-component system nitrogen regulation sensor histidine kinase NtrY